MGALIGIVASTIGPLFLFIAISVFIGSFFKKDKSDANEMAQGCGLGLIISLITLGCAGAVVYRLFKMI